MLRNASVVVYTVLERVGEAGRRDPASRLAWSLAGRTLVVYYGLIPGLSSSPRGARAGGRSPWGGTPCVASRGRRGPKNQQGTLAAASPPLIRLPTRRTAPTREVLSLVLPTSQAPAGLKSDRATSPALNAAPVDHFLLRARPWLRSLARTLRRASCCLRRPKTINRAGTRARVSEGPWQR